MLANANPLQQQLCQNLETHGDQTCTTFLHRDQGMQATPFSGDQLLAAAQARSNTWRSGFGNGPLTLALALPQGADFVISLLAGLICGITVVPLPPNKPNDARLRHIVQDSGARAVMCLPKDLRALERGLGNDLPCPIHDAATAKILLSGPDVTGHDSGAAIIQYTSGSTRMPKGVLLSPQNILANCDLVTRVWRMGPDTRVINWLPHYHDMGLMGCILYPILFGGISVQMSPLDLIRKPISWLTAISDFRGTISGGPAFAFEECLKRISPEDCTNLDLSSWVQVFSGSEPVKADLLPQFQTRFADFGLPKDATYSCYGMAENTLFVTGAPGRSKPNSTNTLAPCHLCDITRPLIQITDPDTSTPCPDGHEGEIWVTGESIAISYLNLPDEADETFVILDGTRWLRTGDLGKIEDGDLFVTGRIKDMLIVNGRNIAATEIEWLAADLDPALNALSAAAFAPDPLTSGTAVLLIELRSGHKSLPNADRLRTTLIRAARGAFGIELIDIRFLPRGTLARTSSGKIRRGHVAKSYRKDAIPMGISPQDGI